MFDTDQNIQNRKIESLTKKVKELERQLCQRTRNYLLFKGMKGRGFVKTEQHQVQTQIQQKSYPTSVFLSQPRSFFNQTVEQSSQGPMTINQKSEEPQVAQFTNFCFQKSTQKIRISDALQKLIQNHNIKKQQNEDKQVETQKQDKEAIIQEDIRFHEKEKRKLRREIKRLQSNLEFEKTVSKYAREGLMISEEQNYQFRIKIKQLLKNSRRETPKESIITTETQTVFQNQEFNQGETNLVEERLYAERQLKQGYFNELNRAKEQIESLKGEIEELHQKIQQLEDSSHKQTKQQAEDQGENERESKYSRQLKQFLQKLKHTSYSISNCIPITDNSEINLFKPENQQQILFALHRVEDYCKQIQKWEKQKLDTIARQKQLFILFIKRLSSSIDKHTKTRLVSQISKIEDMNHYLKIFKEEHKNEHYSFEEYNKTEQNGQHM